MGSAVQTLADIGEFGFLSTLAAELGEILYLRGKDDEALEMTKRSEEAAASDDMATQIQWRRVRSKVLARRGELAEAETLARESVEFARRTDYLNELGQAYESLGVVLAVAGRREEAREAFRESFAAFDRKGNLTYGDRVRERMDELPS